MNNNGIPYQGYTMQPYGQYSRYTPAQYQYQNTTNTPYQQQPVTPIFPQPSGLIGKIVNNESEIAPNDVPMNGTMSVFPKADGSSIFVKTWEPNGTIKTVEYMPVFDAAQSLESDKSSYEEIISRLDRIETKINSRKNTSRNNNSYSKKEGQVNSE